MALNSFRFLHASDLHLDQTPGGLTDLPELLIDPLIESTYRAVDAVFDTALREQVEFVLLSGDVIHFPSASARSLEFLETQFRRLNEQQIPVYWLGGKLEAGHSLPDDFRLPKNVHRLPSTRVQTLEVQRDQRTIAYIVGQSAGKNAYANLDDMRVPRDGRFFVGMWFCENRKELNHDKLDELGIDYWAFGGMHRRHSLDNLIPAEFSGTPQGRSPTETGPHGCLLVNVKGDEIVDTQFIETDSIRYRTEQVTLSAGEDRSHLISKLKSRIQTIRHDVADDKPLLITWEIVDDGPLGRQLRSLDGGDTLREIICRETDSAEKAVWTIAVNSTRSEVPSHLFEEDSILGDFLRVVRDLETTGEIALDIESYLPNTPAAKQLANSLRNENAKTRKRLVGDVATLGVDWLSGEIG